MFWFKDSQDGSVGNIYCVSIEDLSLDSHTGDSGTCLHSHHWGDGDRRPSGATWTVSQEELVSSRFGERLHLKRQGGKWLRRASSINLRPAHAHTCAYAQSHIHTYNIWFHICVNLLFHNIKGHFTCGHAMLPLLKFCMLYRKGGKEILSKCVHCTVQYTEEGGPRNKNLHSSSINKSEDHSWSPLCCFC